MMDEINVDGDISAHKTCLLQRMISNKENFDVLSFLSFMSICYKQIIGNDNIVQNFETNIIRPNGRIFGTINEIIDFMDNEHNSGIKNQFKAIKKVLMILQEVQAAIAAVTDSNHAVDAITTDGANTERLLGQIAGDCLERITECIPAGHTENDKHNETQLSIDDVVKSIVIKLSPTTGILYLNNNPYKFFAEKILSLSQVEAWENMPNAKLYGTIVHKIFEKFAIECKQMYKDALPDTTMMRKIFFNISDRLLLETNTNDENFIKEKINKLFDIAYKLERAASRSRRFVLTEAEFSTKIQGVTISAKADRVEIDYQRKEIYIYDFKTGTLPSNSDERNGVKAQLAIIGYLILNDEKYKDFKISLMRYVDVSGKGIGNKQNDIGLEEINCVEAKLKKMIDVYFNNCSPIINNMPYIQDYQQNKFDIEHNLAYYARDEFLV